MPRPDIAPSAPRFRLWIRRQAHADGAYSLRFAVEDGKGILRVSRPGVLIDPPARPSWEEERLTSAQLRSSRFLLVWDGGRARQAHLLTRLAEADLLRLAEGVWTELVILIEAGFRHLVLAPAPTSTASDAASLSAAAVTTATPAFPFSPASLSQASTRSAFSTPPTAFAAHDHDDTDEDRRAVPVKPRDVTTSARRRVASLPEPEEDLFIADMDEVTEEEPPRKRAMLPQDHEGFGVDDEMMFSVDTPSNRLETMHVMRGSVEAVTFLPGASAEPESDEFLLPADEAEEGVLSAQEADDGILSAHEADEDLIAAGEAEDDLPGRAVPGKGAPEHVDKRGDGGGRAAPAAESPFEAADDAASGPGEDDDDDATDAPRVRDALDSPTEPSPPRRRRRAAPPEATEAEAMPERSSALPPASSAIEALRRAPDADNTEPLPEPVSSSEQDDEEPGVGEEAIGLEPGEAGEPHPSRASPLIRHLRRQIGEAQARMMALEARIQELEAALAAARDTSGR